MEKQKSRSSVSMGLVQSTGAWLNGCLQQQMHFVSLEIEDPNGKILARVELSFEQAARMLLYNGNVECTLSRYRDESGEMAKETVEIPETVHERMKERLGEAQGSILKRLADLEKDAYEIVNGDKSASKGAMKSMLSDIRTVRDHLVSDQNFVLQQSEEELQAMQSSVTGQLGLYLQSKTGVMPAEEILTQLIPISNAPLMIGEAKPVMEDYKTKEREAKPIDEMTASDVSEEIHSILWMIERSGSEGVDLYNSGASFDNKNVYIRYISYQENSKLTIDEAKEYLKFLKSVDKVGKFKRHFNYKDKA